MAETRLSPTATNPFKSPVVDARGIDKTRPNSGIDGITVAPLNDFWTTKTLHEHEDGLWGSVMIGDVILIACYLAPRQDAELVAFDNMKSQMLRDYPNNPVVVVGDFNARLQRLGDSGNHGTRERQRWMRAWLDDPEWTRLEPTSGLWTTNIDNGGRSGSGRGVTDLVFLNGHAVQRVSNLVVHEDDDTVDTDHRLLTFSIRMEAKFQKPPFERLNIWKLFEKRAEYKRAIDESSDDTLDQLMTLRDVLMEAADAREIWSWEKRQEIADLASDSVTDWLVSVLLGK
ncbi:hypothetical protein HDU98_000821 [Podochytrium sp. JEL0797]|nr:hypothetical protein HDU98_000821 [Podochytrium sp. JEL0797]